MRHASAEKLDLKGRIVNMVGLLVARQLAAMST
jgi:hypothetical protein